MNNLKGKVAIVTGSSRGVGASTAVKLAETGCNVVINYTTSETEAKKTMAACEAAGAETLLCRADVSKDEDCRRMVAEAMGKWNRIDALVNNAGTTKFCDHNDLDGLEKEDFLHIYAVNVIGPYQMIRAAVPHMKKSGRGSVVNVASIAAITGIGSSIAYAASKGALVTMTLSLARVLGPEIRVNAVCPGFIQGRWLKEGLGDEFYEAIKTHLEGSAPLGVTATAETVADAILYFLWGAEIITGETLILDGGNHLSQTPLMRR
ncbi:MAG: SDR family oxidoreductase [Deltaproteobacteria bacterium]|nr:SDR family oxidoreductase [Deltaproteobacteria bacterium]